MKYFLLSAFLAVMALAAAPTPKSVRVIYIVSADRDENPAYTQAIRAAALSVQEYYRQQLGGVTFHLSDPVVEVVKSDKDASWFYGHVTDQGPDNYGYNNTLAEAHRLLGAGRNDPNFVWVIYSDGPGSSGRGGNGVCIMPENDLLGLLGKRHNHPDPRRWIGGYAHELGHAFGLDHPRDTKKHANSIMWTGFYESYPNGAYITDEHKAQLMKNPFFFDAAGKPVAGGWETVAKYNRRDGHIIRQRHSKTGEIQWIQSVANGTSVITFHELSESGGFYHLKRFGASSTFEVRLPVSGGASQIRTRERPQWSPFENFTKVE